MAESTALLKRHTRKGIEGSNPSLTALPFQEAEPIRFGGSAGGIKTGARRGQGVSPERTSATGGASSVAREAAAQDAHPTLPASRGLAPPILANCPGPSGTTDSRHHIP